MMNYFGINKFMATITIQEAINQAKQNPTSDFAKALRVSIESGQLDEAAKIQGVDLSVYGRPKISVIEETTVDIEEFVPAIKQRATERADNIADIKESKQGAISKSLQTVGQGAGFFSDIVGEALKTGAKALVPSQKGEDYVARKFEDFATVVGGTRPVQEITNAYARLKETNPTTAKNLAAGANLLLLGLDVAGGSLVAKPTKSAVSRATRKALATGEMAGETAGRLAGKGTAEMSGALTGTSGETIEQAFKSAMTGGEQLKAYTDALRKVTTPEQIVDSARSGVQLLSSEKTKAFGDMLRNIGGKTVEVGNIKKQIADDLKAVGVTITKDGLEFGASKFRTVPQAQTKLNQLWVEANRFGKTATISEIDTARQALRALELTGDDASARTANMVINKAIDVVRKTGGAVDGYADALAKFGDDASFLDELNRSLSTGDQATIDTAYRKLATTLKTNNEQRLQLLQQLDERTGGTLLSSIAGQQMSEELPRGIFRQIMAGAAGMSALTGGVSASILPTLFFASPRVTGEVLRAMGISAAKTKALIRGVEAANKLLK